MNNLLPAVLADRATLDACVGAAAVVGAVWGLAAAGIAWPRVVRWWRAPVPPTSAAPPGMARGFAVVLRGNGAGGLRRETDPGGVDPTGFDPTNN